MLLKKVLRRKALLKMSFFSSLLSINNFVPIYYHLRFCGVKVQFELTALFYALLQKYFAPKKHSVMYTPRLACDIILALYSYILEVLHEKNRKQAIKR